MHTNLHARRLQDHIDWPPQKHARWGLPAAPAFVPYMLDHKAPRICVARSGRAHFIVRHRQSQRHAHAHSRFSTSIRQSGSGRWKIRLGGAVSRLEPSISHGHLELMSNSLFARATGPPRHLSVPAVFPLSPTFLHTTKIVSRGHSFSLSSPKTALPGMVFILLAPRGNPSRQGGESLSQHRDRGMLTGSSEVFCSLLIFIFNHM